MFRPSRRRVTILLLLLLALVGPWAAAAEAGGNAEPAWWQPGELAAQIWNALVRLWGDLLAGLARLFRTSYPSLGADPALTCDMLFGCYLASLALVVVS